MSQNYNEYHEITDKLIAYLQKNESTTKVDVLQAKLDNLADVYQSDNELGAQLYKLYVIQSLIHYRNGKDEAAVQWMQGAVNIKGESFSLADEFLSQVDPSGEIRINRQNEDTSADDSTAGSVISLQSLVQAVAVVGGVLIGNRLFGSIIIGLILAGILGAIVGSFFDKK